MATFVQQPCDEVLIHSKAAVAPCARTSGPWILAATILGSSMAFIDGTAVNVALPALQQSLGATVIDVQWIVESYSLLLSALLLMGGSLGDYYGRRRIFIAGVAIFSLASAWCGFASNVRELIFARAMQGAGAALLAGRDARDHRSWIAYLRLNRILAVAFRSPRCDRGADWGHFFSDLVLIVRSTHEKSNVATCALSFARFHRSKFAHAAAL